MIPSSTPNAEQKRWREAVRELGSIVSGGPAVIHHCVGRAARHQKVSIGHEFIIGLTDAEHKLLHSDMRAFEALSIGFNPGGRWDCEKFLFNRVCELLGKSPDCFDIIMDYHR